MLLGEHEWQKDFVEAMLAHKEEGVAGVYNKAGYLKQRRGMMQWYADYLEVLESGIRYEMERVLTSRLPARLATGRG
jgi:hypothetical protein